MTSSLESSNDTYESGLRIKAEKYLDYLIDSGSDAPENLYSASFVLSEELKKSLPEYNIFKGEKGDTKLAVRLIGYSSPSKKVSTLSLPFQNTTIDIIAPSSDQNSHKLSLTFRMDDSYSLYDLLCRSVPLKENGKFNDDFRGATLWDSITVTPLKGSDLDLNPSVQWIYNNCYLLNVPSLSYGYSKGSTLTVNCEFLYQSYTNNIDTLPKVSQNS